MKKMTYKQLVKICDKEGWLVYPSDNTIELRQSSPAGEDFSFTINKKGDYIEQIENYADNFNADEHVEMWVDAKRNGVSGVPRITELVDDARDIQQMLNNLVKAVNGLK